jgi:hypothetical protein
MELTKEIIPESISSVPSHPALPASVDDLTYLSPVSVSVSVSVSSS